MRRALLLAVLLVASLAPAAQAADVRTALLVTDAAGDQAIIGPTVPPTQATPAPTYANVDILAVLASQPTVAPTAVSIFVNFSAPPTARQTVQFQFALKKGPDSVPTSSASGASKTVSVTGTTVTGADGATASGTGKQLVLDLPYASIGASPGDLLDGLVVTASDKDGGPTGGGPLPDQVTADDSSASDRAPDSGGAPGFTLQPPAFHSDLAAAVTGGQVQASNGTWTFMGPAAATNDANATVRFDVRVTNHATAPDTVQLVAPGASPGIQFALPGPATIAAGAEATLAVTMRLSKAAVGTLTPSFEVAGLDGSAVTTATLVVLPPPSKGHTPVPPALKFLTPVVKALGLIGPLGDYAELAFLLLLVLIAIVVAFLALTLVQTPWLRIEVEPRRALASPGGFAEFRVRLDHAKAGVAAAKAVLRSAPWVAAFRFRGAGAAGAEGQPYDVRVDPENPAEGILRVEVPEGTPSLERETVEFDIVPMDADGLELPRHRARSHVTVQALQPAGFDPKVPKARDIRLQAVRHEPSDPLPGGLVTTVASVHNGGGAAAALRLVLVLDGRPVVEERIEVAAHGDRDVRLPWTAGAGKNQVKVQVFLA